MTVTVPGLDCCTSASSLTAICPADATQTVLLEVVMGIQV